MKWHWAAFAALAACGPTNGDDPCQGGESPSVAVGTGDGAYVPVENGCSMELVRGPQGGVHLTIGLEATGLDPAEPAVAVLTGTIDGAEVALAQPYVYLRCNQEVQALQAWDLRLIYDAPPEDLTGRATDIEVELTDADGRVARGDVNVSIVGPLE